MLFLITATVIFNILLLTCAAFGILSSILAIIGLRMVSNDDGQGDLFTFFFYKVTEKYFLIYLPNTDYNEMEKNVMTVNYCCSSHSDFSKIFEGPVFGTGSSKNRVSGS